MAQPTACLLAPVRADVALSAVHQEPLSLHLLDVAAASGHWPNSQLLHVLLLILIVLLFADHLLGVACLKLLALLHNALDDVAR